MVDSTQTRWGIVGLVLLGACAGSEGVGVSVEAEGLPSPDAGARGASSETSEPHAADLVAPTGEDTAGPTTEADAGPDGSTGPGGADAVRGSETPQDALPSQDTGDPGADTQDAGGPTELPPPIHLNELHCASPEWVELHSLAEVPVDLTGWALDDEVDDESGRWILPEGSLIEPGAFLVLYRDGADGQPGYGFGLQCGAESAWLFGPEGQLAQSAEATETEPGTTIGRLPDGQGAWTPTWPTPGAPNLGLDAPQPEGPPDPALLFLDPLLAEPPGLHLQLSELAYASLEASPYQWVPASLTVTEGEVVTELEVSARLKGKYGSFRPLGQKSAFKIDLIPAGEGEGLHGLENLTLNNMVQDSAKIAEAMAYGLFRAVDVPAPHVGYAHLQVNSEDYGLYLDVESIDGTFLAKRYEETLHLWEGEYGTDIVPGNVAGFDLDEGSSKDTISLLELALAVVEPPGPEWFDTVGALVDLDEMAHMWAVEIFIGHWDGYAPTINNYFLHEDGAGVFTMMPWGTDQTFDAWLALHEGGGVLFQRCLATPACGALYEYALVDVLAAVTDAGIVELGADIAATVQPHYFEDPMAPHGAAHAADAAQEAMIWLLERAAWLEGRMACLASDTPDGDGDGALCSQDCDDGDPAIAPGMPEICDDGIDQDCSGLADDGLGCKPVCELASDGETLYHLCIQELPWEIARSQCQAAGGDLPILDSEEESELIRDLATEAGLGWTWFGLTDLEEEDEFLWVDGTPLDEDLALWGPGEPNDAGGEDCVHWMPNGHWNDLPCEAPIHFVCETPCADLEPGACELEEQPPAAICEELFRGPHRYLFCDTAGTWAEARASCKAQDADLVVLDVAAEGLWLQGAISATWGGGGGWIGLGDHHTEGIYRWVDGSAPTWEAWAPNEPNDWGPGEDCVEVVDGGLWNDLVCDWERRWICEDLCEEDQDEDNDGALRCGEDCDDDDPDLHPGAAEVCGDGIDQDCSGIADDGPDCAPPMVELDVGGELFVALSGGAPWEAAREACVALGLELAWFDDAGQQGHARALMVGGHGLPGAPWLGALPAVAAEPPAWAIGVGPTWSAWGVGQPDLDPSEESPTCLTLDTGARWDDSPCAQERVPLCRSLPTALP